MTETTTQPPPRPLKWFRARLDAAGVLADVAKRADGAYWVLLPGAPPTVVPAADARATLVAVRDPDDAVVWHTAQAQAILAARLARYFSLTTRGE